jgi:hypothetical protein
MLSTLLSPSPQPSTPTVTPTRNSTTPSSSLETDDTASLRAQDIPSGDEIRTDTHTESPLVVFAPTDDIMYPLKGELQDLGRHRGVTVEMRGYGEVMEGVSRRECRISFSTVTV